MDVLSVVFGLIIGIAVGAALGWNMRGAESGGTRVSLFRPLRISKGNVECYDCGTQMKERYPGSAGARRFWACPACNRFDSYIDHEMASEYQAKHS